VEKLAEETWVACMTKHLADLSLSCRLRKGTRRDDAARCIAIAQTHIETAELWLEKAARYGEENAATLEP
jgi:hypothetical protein